MSLRLIAIVAPFLLILAACKKKEREGAPVVTTAPLTDIFSSDAVAGGRIYFDGNSEITSRGICWVKEGEPTINDQVVEVPGSSETFTCTLQDLTPQTTYYVRAFATNGFGTGYGAIIKFRTADTPYPPFITAPTILSISTSSAVVSATFQVQPGTPIPTETGFYWSSSNVPTINDPHIAVKANLGVFTATITGLEKGTSYYVLPYAKSRSVITYGSSGTARTYYGSMTDIDGNSYKTILVNGKEWTAENLRVTRYRDGSPIPLVSDFSQWLGSSDGYSYYENNQLFQSMFGNLYNFGAVKNTKGLAPLGWHVPTKTEWDNLITALGGMYDAAGTSHDPNGDWSYNPGYYDNSSGFSIKAGGYRLNGGTYDGRRNYTYFWTQTVYSANMAYYYNVASYFYSSIQDNHYGCYVRLIKD